MKKINKKLKKPWLAALLNLIWMGLGYIYIKKSFLGLLFMLADIFLFFPGYLVGLGEIIIDYRISWAIWIIRIAITYDAYHIAKEVNY